MQNPCFKCFLKHVKSNRGFSLIELMVVMVIVAILATGVVFMFADPTAKVKAAAFEMRGDFNLARAEAVRRNDEILIEFIYSAKERCSKENPLDCCSAEDPTKFLKCFSGGTQQGYVLCVDATPTAPITDPPSCSNEGATASDLEEKIIKTILFRDALQYYEFGATLPSASSGPIPTTAPDGVALASNNGITFGGGNYIYMNSDGTSSDTGSVVVYLPKDGNPATLTVRGKPFAVVVDSVSTGRVRLERWRPDLDAWSRK